MADRVPELVSAADTVRSLTLATGELVDVVDWGAVEPVAVGQMESRTAQLGAMVVTRHVIPAGFDSTPFYRGLPNNMCPCEHWCVLMRGRMRYRYVDGHTQTVEAGQVFRVAPGHLADGGVPSPV